MLNKRKEGNLPMAEQSFMRVEEVAAELGVSKSYAYKIVQKLNGIFRHSHCRSGGSREYRHYLQLRTSVSVQTDGDGRQIKHGKG